MDAGVPGKAVKGSKIRAKLVGESAYGMAIRGSDGYVGALRERVNLRSWIVEIAG
jgi:hypothetical protein